MIEKLNFEKYVHPTYANPSNPTTVLLYM